VIDGVVQRQDGVWLPLASGMGDGFYEDDPEPGGVDFPRGPSLHVCDPGRHCRPREGAWTGMIVGQRFIT
jgi:hypothetical protein